MTVPRSNDDVQELPYKRLTIMISPKFVFDPTGRLIGDGIKFELWYTDERQKFEDNLTNVLLWSHKRKRRCSRSVVDHTKVKWWYTKVDPTIAWRWSHIRSTTDDDQIHYGHET